MSRQAPRFGSDEKNHRRLIADAANSAIRGELEITGAATFSSGSTSTTLTDARFGKGRYVLMVPLDSYGAGLGWWMSSIADGTCTIGHAAPSHDAAFGWVVLGTGASR